MFLNNELINNKLSAVGLLQSDFSSLMLDLQCLHESFRQLMLKTRRFIFKL